MIGRVTLLILSLFAIWRIVLLFLSANADHFLAYQPTFPYATELLAQSGWPKWFYSWANFDGVHYYTIAKSGYIGTGLIQAFFPLYPLLVGSLAYLIGDIYLAGLLIANIAFLGVLFLLYLLVKKYFSKETAWTSLVVVLLFPTSFFFGALYSESLFLLLVLLSFYFASEKKWLYAGLCAIAITATRIVGVFIIPALLLELYFQDQKVFSLQLKRMKKFFAQKWKEALFIVSGLFGIGSYMWFLWGEFRDPFYFWHVQEEFGGGREESIILLPQVIWRYVKILTTVPFGLSWYVYLQELLFGVVPLAVIIYLWLKKKNYPKSWLLFAAAALVIPTLTGTFSSMPRYVLVAFPLYIFLAELLHRSWQRYLFYAVSAILLTVNLVLFIQGYWVA